MFSHRTDFPRNSNPLARLLSERSADGTLVHDLTISNPTLGTIPYPTETILSALHNPAVMRYDPNPQGLITARESIATYYRDKAAAVSPEDIFLTASTSEAYLLIMKLLCNAGDGILVPSPSYPLFELLAQLSDVRLIPYDLRYDGEWHVDIDSIHSSLTDSVRAIIVIHPHNPTGMFLKNEEYEAIVRIAASNRLAIIVDEVFLDYPIADGTGRLTTAAASGEVLTFTFGGLSKMAGLPQLKLGWMAVSGPSELRESARSRLLLLCDTLLSVNTPVQIALPELMEIGKAVSESIRNTLRANYSTLRTVFDPESRFTTLYAEGGWYGCVRVPSMLSDEEWAMELLSRYHVYVYPGYYFDFRHERVLVVSLLSSQLDKLSVLDQINVSPHRSRA